MLGHEDNESERASSTAGTEHNVNPLYQAAFCGEKGEEKACVRLNYSIRLVSSDDDDDDGPESEKARERIPKMQIRTYEAVLRHSKGI